MRRNLHPYTSRKIIHRLDKISAAVIHQEANGAAVRTAIGTANDAETARAVTKNGFIAQLDRCGRQDVKKMP